MQADEVEARFACDQPALVPRLAVLVEHRQIDPVETGVIPGAPDHVGDIAYHAAVREDRPTILHAGHSGHALDTCRPEVASPGPNERTASRQDARPDLSADGRVHGQDAME